jgi:glycosyltransferase involved in cell wall biosynthesis
MRIAVVTTSYPAYEGDPSGHFVHSEVMELERLGHDVQVIRPPPGGAFGWPGAPTRIREQPLRALSAGRWLAHAALALRRSKAERVIAHWCVPSAFPIATSVMTMGTLEIVSHGGDIRLLVALPSGLRTRIIDTLLDRATTWRFVSEDLRQTLRTVLDDRGRARLDAISDIVPAALTVPDVHADASAKRTALKGRRLYVCAGRLVASKRIDKVIDYVATSTDHGTKRSERTLIVLGDGPERPHLERLAKAWQMDVRFLGKTSRREALGWIGAADELVHASRVEGLSTVVREAEQLGVPVTLLC